MTFVVFTSDPICIPLAKTRSVEEVLVVAKCTHLFL